MQTSGNPNCDPLDQPDPADMLMLDLPPDVRARAYLITIEVDEPPADVPLQHEAAGHTDNNSRLPDIKLARVGFAAAAAMAAGLEAHRLRTQHRDLDNELNAVAQDLPDPEENLNLAPDARAAIVLLAAGYRHERFHFSEE